ncbi:MAG TPA: ankyrin repeat domain-containing protein [Verrucomicrobiae bacterium]|nr:ankyrin repeat domain-containing protein [Verrucomicrobiae bacterium]
MTLSALILPSPARAELEIFRAVDFGYGLGAVAEVLAATGDANIRSGMERNTPLLAAAKKAAAANSLRYVVEDEWRGADAETVRSATSGVNFSQLFRLLVSYGAEVDAADKYGETSLVILSRKPDLRPLSQLLISLGANPGARDRTGTPILINSIRSCDAADTHFWIASGADVGTVDRGGMSALLHSVAAECLDGGVVDELLRKGADADQADARGRTPLLVVIQRGKADLAERMLAGGASPQARDKVTGETPLHAAVRGSLPEVAKMLVERGADVNAADAQGDTPLHLSAFKRNVDLAEYLLSSGALPDGRNNSGKTPLAHAVGTCQSGLARLLLKAGAAPAADRGLKTVLETASARCPSDFVWQLREISQP